MTAKITTPTDLIAPRIVSLKELRDKLLPKVGGWSWAEDALVDLWKLGSPDPQHSMCPQVAEKSGPPCPMRECPHVKRLLMPRQFQQWWSEVQQRQGWEMTAAQALTKKRPK